MTPWGAAPGPAPRPLPPPDNHLTGGGGVAQLRGLDTGGRGSAPLLHQILTSIVLGMDQRTGLAFPGPGKANKPVISRPHLRVLAVIHHRHHGH